MRGWAALGVALAEGTGTSTDVSNWRVPWQTGETAYLPATLRPCAPGSRRALRSFICLDLCEGWESGGRADSLLTSSERCAVIGDRQRCADPTSVVMVGVGNQEGKLPNSPVVKSMKFSIDCRSIRALENSDNKFFILEVIM